MPKADEPSGDTLAHGPVDAGEDDPHARLVVVIVVERREQLLQVHVRDVLRPVRGLGGPVVGRVTGLASQVEQHVQHAGLSEPLDRDGGHHALQLFFDLVGRGCGLVLVAELSAEVLGERGGVRVVEDQVGDSVSPVAALSRLRSSTAVSESKPWSENARSAAMASGVGSPRTVAMWERTSPSSTAC